MNTRQSHGLIFFVDRKMRGTYTAPLSEQIQVAFDAVGNAIAVWLEFSVSINAWPPVSGRDTKKIVDPYFSGGSRDPQVLFDNAGNAMAIWAEFDGTRRSIKVNHFE